MSGRARVPRLLLVAFSVLVGASLLACGGTSDEEERERLADDLVAETDGALDDDTARCVADALHDQFGEDSFDRVLDAAAGESSDDDEDEVRLRVIDVFAGCDALGPIIDESP